MLSGFHVLPPQSSYYTCIFMFICMIFFIIIKASLLHPTVNSIRIEAMSGFAQLSIPGTKTVPGTHLRHPGNT